MPQFVLFVMGKDPLPPEVLDAISRCDPRHSIHLQVTIQVADPSERGNLSLGQAIKATEEQGGAGFGTCASGAALDLLKGRVQSLGYRPNNPEKN